MCFTNALVHWSSLVQVPTEYNGVGLTNTQVGGARREGLDPLVGPRACSCEGGVVFPSCCHEVPPLSGLPVK